MAQTTLFTLFEPVFFVVVSFVTFHISVVPIVVINMIQYRKKDMNGKKHVLMAQTTCFTLFGPVFLVIVSLYPLHSFIVSIIPVKISQMISIYKKDDSKLTQIDCCMRYIQVATGQKKKRLTDKSSFTTILQRIQMIFFQWLW